MGAGARVASSGSQRARMTADQRQRVRDLFEAALDRHPSSDVGSWLAREAADDPAGRDEVLSLFEHHSRAGAFLAEPIAGHFAELMADREPLAPGPPGPAG